MEVVKDVGLITCGRMVYIAMGQYSSLGEGAVVNFLDAVDIWRGSAGQSAGRVRKRRGKRQRETGEGQNEDADNERSSTHHGWHEDGMSATQTH